MVNQRLAPNQEDKIRDMRAQGKTPQECVDYMKKTYGIDVPLWKISYVVGKGRAGKKRARGGGKVKKQFNNRLEVTEAMESKLGMAVPIEEAVKDITKGMQQIFEGYTAIFMHLRLEVIKEAGKVFRMAKEAGIEIKGEDIQE